MVKSLLFIFGYFLLARHDVLFESKISYFGKCVICIPLIDVILFESVLIVYNVIANRNTERYRPAPNASGHVHTTCIQTADQITNAKTEQLSLLRPKMEIAILCVSGTNIQGVKKTDRNLSQVRIFN